MNHVWSFPQIRLAVFLCIQDAIRLQRWHLCKQCQVLHMSLFGPPDKTDSASYIPSPVCPRLCVHLVPIGSSDRVLVTSNSQHKASVWDRWTTEETGSCLHEHTSSCVCCFLFYFGVRGSYGLLLWQSVLFTFASDVLSYKKSHLYKSP